MKHSKAKKVTIEATVTDNMAILSIKDDGQGFDTSKKSVGYGLAGLKHRLELVRGLLTIESVPGKGTTITAEAPLNL